VNRGDTARWQTARSLGDPGELTALFLEGKICETPSHCGPPDQETSPLVPILAAVNRAEFVTDQSQPGIPPDEHGSAQRANVSGFADSGTFAALATALADTDLVITAARAPRGKDNLGPFITITLDMGEESTWDGGAQSRIALEYHYGQACHPDAVRALCNAWQVTLIDPEWGRNDVLWAVLARFAASMCT
jgi:hypothetical protein